MQLNQPLNRLDLDRIRREKKVEEGKEELAKKKYLLRAIEYGIPKALAIFLYEEFAIKDHSHAHE